MLRNRSDRCTGSNTRDVLNEVLSLNAQEWIMVPVSTTTTLLNEVLSLNAQEFTAAS